jgi:hypothetical protein
MGLDGRAGLVDLDSLKITFCIAGAAAADSEQRVPAMASWKEMNARSFRMSLI